MWLQWNSSYVIGSWQTWGKAAAALSNVAVEAAAVEKLTEECASGVEEACDALRAFGKADMIAE